MNLFTLLTYATSFSFLTYASIQDIKTQTVTNKTWLLYAPTALFLAIANLTTQNPTALLLYVINICLTFIIAVALWEIGAYGGADTKALICVSFAHPTSLLVLAYTSLLMLGANLKKKKENLPLIPFMTLALAFVLIQVLLI